MANDVLLSQKDEVFYEANVNTLAGNSAVQFLFPPEVLYNSNGKSVIGYNHIPNDEIVNVDIAYLKVDTYKDAEQAATYKDGDFKDTNVAGAFYAIDKEDYFYLYDGSSNTLTAPALKRVANKPRLAEVIDLPVGSTGGTFTNQTLGMFTPNVNRFDDIEVEGLNEGYKPDGMRMLAARLEKFDAEDVTLRCFDIPTISAGVNNNITDANAVASKIDADLLREDNNIFVHEDSLFNASNPVSAIEIVNVERALSDFRYGDVEDVHELELTDVSYVFTDAELAQVAAGTSTPISSLSVGGGDCYLGLHTFKVSNSTYAISDPEKGIEGTGPAGTKTTQTAKWDHWFDLDGDSANEIDVSRPIPLKGVSQTVTVWLESEINPEAAEAHPHKGYADATPYPIPDSAGQIRSNFKYYYSKDYVKENDDKTFTPYSSFETDTTKYNSRVYFTDQKVYKSDVEGFDRVRALNSVDLDETYGDIAGFWPIQDNVVVFQGRGVSVLPIDAGTIESADGSTLSIRSGEILGIPRYITTTYGTQHPKTIAGDGNNVFAIDNRNKVVLGVSSEGLDIISDRGMRSYFETNLGSVTADYLFGIYDTLNKQYIAGNRNSFTTLYDTIDKIWIGRWPNTSSVNMMDGEVVGGALYLILENAAGNRIGINLAEAGTYGTWGSDTTLPEFTIYFNQEPVIPKIFDTLNWNADKPITEIDVTVPQAAASNSMTATALDVSSLIGYREGTYRLAKSFRATNATYLKERFRGMLMELTSKFAQGATGKVSSIASKYRPSHRAI